MEFWLQLYTVFFPIPFLKVLEIVFLHEVKVNDVVEIELDAPSVEMKEQQKPNFYNAD